MLKWPGKSTSLSIERIGDIVLQISFNSELLEEQIKMLQLLYAKMNNLLWDVIAVEKDINEYKQNKVMQDCGNAITAQKISIQKTINEIIGLSNAVRMAVDAFIHCEAELSQAAGLSQDDQRVLYSKAIGFSAQDPHGVLLLPDIEWRIQTQLIPEWLLKMASRYRKLSQQLISFGAETFAGINAGGVIGNGGD